MPVSFLLERFYENAKLSKDSEAVFYQEKTLTYRELLEQVELYAKKITYLTEEKASETPICLLSNDKLMLVILQLAVLRAGKFFAILDHQSPTSVIKDQIEKFGTELTIVAGEENTFCQKWKKDLSLEQILSSNELLEKQDAALPEEISDDSLAYVLLTSGSTGAPKAVAQTHDGLFQQMQRYYKIINIEGNRGERFSNFAPLCHDQGIVDVFAAMLSPAAKLSLFDMQTLFSSDNGIQNARDFLKQQKIFIFSALPEVFKKIFDEQSKNTFPDLRVIAIGAEAVKAEHLRVFLDSCPKESVLYNSYGASECSWICGFSLTKEEAKKYIDKPSIPIGYPDNTLTMMIKPLEDSENAETGELWIAGKGVSPGYFKNPAATEKAFIQHEGKWFYKTGDIVERQEDGNFLHKGRLARLAKISGKRVDINELEIRLCELLRVEKCIVEVVALGKQDNSCAFILSSSSSSASASNTSKTTWSLGAANSVIQDNLAMHLRPQYLFKIDQFPTLPSGKINRAALDEIVRNTFSKSSDFQGSDIERLVYSALIETTGIEGQWDKEFASIMNSITRATFLASLNRSLRKGLIQFSDFLEYPTPKQLAKALQKRLDNPVDPNKIEFNYYKDTDILKISHEMIKQFMLYFMERSPDLNLKACISLNDFMEKIDEQFKSKTARVGYTVPMPQGHLSSSSDDRESHATACFVEYNQSADKLIVWVSDSVFTAAGEISFHLKKNPDIKPKIETVYVDDSQRQSNQDFYNCTFDAMSFLLFAFSRPSLQEYIIPPEHINPKIGNIFFPPKEEIHRIPLFLDKKLSALNLYNEYKYPLEILGDFYSKLMCSIFNKIKKGTPIPEIQEIFTIDQQCIELNAEKNKDFDVEYPAITDGAKLGRLLREKPQCGDYFATLKQQQKMMLILPDIKNYCFFLCHLNKMQRDQIYACSQDFFLSYYVSSLNVGVLFDLANLLGNEIFEELCNSESFQKRILLIFDDVDYFLRYRFCNRLNMYKIYDVVENKIITKIYSMHTLYSVLSVISESQRSRLINRIESNLCNMIHDNEQLVCALHLCCLYPDLNDKLYTAVEKKMYELVGNIENLSRLLHKTTLHHELSIDHKTLSLLLTPKMLNTLNWHEESDIPTVEPFLNLKTCILDKINEKAAIKAFIIQYPEWNEGSVEGTSMEKIMRVACEEKPKSDFFAHDNIRNAVRVALLAFGVGRDLLDNKKIAVDQKAKLAVQKILGNKMSPPKNSSEFD